MITITASVNTSIMSRDYHFFFFVVRIFKIWSLGNFEVYNSVLLIIIIMLCIRSPELIHLLTGNLYPLTNTSPIPCLQPLVTNILLSVSTSSAFLDSTYKRYHTVYVFLYLNHLSLSIMPSRSIHTEANGRISFFLTAA